MREKTKLGSSAKNQHHYPRHRSEAILELSAQGSLPLNATTSMNLAGTTKAETSHPPLTPSLTQIPDPQNGDQPKWTLV